MVAPLTMISSIGHGTEALLEYQKARDLYDQLLEADPGNEPARKASAASGPTTSTCRRRQR